MTDPAPAQPLHAAAESSACCHPIAQCRRIEFHSNILSPCSMAVQQAAQCLCHTNISANRIIQIAHCGFHYKASGWRDEQRRTCLGDVLMNAPISSTHFEPAAELCIGRHYMGASHQLCMCMSTVVTARSPRLQDSSSCGSTGCYSLSVAVYRQPSKACLAAAHVQLVGNTLANRAEHIQVLLPHERAI